MIAPGPPLCASRVPDHPAELLQVDPAASASLFASHAAAKPMKVNMLRASFIRVPAPGSPACTTNEAHCLNAGLIALVRLVGRRRP